MEEQEHELDGKSFVLVEFAEAGSVVLRMVTDNVTPLQLLAVASYLEVMGKSKLMEQENERLAKETKLAMPENKLIIPGR
jgi:hypothetical protein